MNKAFEHAGQTRMGRHRSENESGFSVLATHSLCCVVDAHTSHSHGGSFVAKLSLAAVETLFSCTGDHGDAHDAGLLRKGIECAHRCIEQVNSTSPVSFTGATIAAMAISSRHVHFASVGDCRLYRLRDEELTLLTVDDTVIEDVRRRGVETSAAQREWLSVHGDAITRHLGKRGELTVEVRTEEHRPDDIYLLCTKGLHAACKEVDIVALLSKDRDLNRAANDLVDTANKLSGRHNITCVLVRIP